MKRILIVLTLLILSFTTFAACRNGSKQSPQPTVPQSYSQNNTVTDASSNMKSSKVTLYFANREYVTTGSEKLPKILPEIRNISYSTSKEEAVVRELMKGTKNPKLRSEIPEKVKLNSAKVKGDTATVDFASQNLSGSSMQEMLMIDEIVATLTSFGNIKNVQFTVDGKVVESLMGHMDALRPYTKGF